MEYVGVNIIKHSQPRGIKLKMKGHKLRSGIKAKRRKTRATCIQIWE
jgi:hypothetical protein